MTRRGSPEEQEWRRDRSDDPGLDGSLHNTMPVPPRGRRPREKPQGHKHEEPQPPDEHGAGKHDDSVADNPHGQGTHDGSVAGDPHGQPTHDGSVATNPHADEAHSKQTVENLVGSPSRSRNTRANQPAPSNVGVGSEYRVEDEGDVLEIATDTDDDGVADSWAEPSATHGHPGLADDPHDDAQHSRDYDADFVNVGGDSMSGGLNIMDDAGGRLRLAGLPDNGRQTIYNKDSGGGDHGRIDMRGDLGFVDLRSFDGTSSVSVRADGANDRVLLTALSIRADGVLTVGDDEVWHEGNFSPASKADTHSHPYVDESGDTMSGDLTIENAGIVWDRDGNTVSAIPLSSGNLDIDANHSGGRARTIWDAANDRFIVSGTDLTVGGALDVEGSITSGGTVRSERSGIGSVFIHHTNDPSRNTGGLSITDGEGTSTSIILYGPGDTGEPGVQFDSGISVDHADITLDGGDVIANKSSHGGNIVAEGWIDAGESISSQTYLEAQGRIASLKSGSASDPAICVFTNGTQTDPRAGIYHASDSSGDNRLVIAGDSVAIAYFDPGGDRWVLPNSDAGAHLGASNLRWDDVYCYTLNEASDPALKTDMHPVAAADAVRRVRDTAGAAISFRWKNGRRTHLGFDADKIGGAHGDESAAFADPAVNGDQGREPVEGERAEPTKSIRPVELIADLYVAVAALTDRVADLEAA